MSERCFPLLFVNGTMVTETPLISASVLFLVQVCRTGEALNESTFAFYSSTEPKYQTQYRQFEKFEAFLVISS